MFNFKYQRVSRWLLVVLFPSFLIACGEKQPSVVQQAVAIESGDECHLCGMLISQFPGPKGEIFNRKATKAHKFCSTRDLFAYYLQPENTRQVQQIFVHDMTKTPWDAPDDEHFTDAKTAWYVRDHNQRGSMGATLASFSAETDAQAFATAYGGTVISFDMITLDLLASL
jgi:copper chaperone NosL